MDISNSKNISLGSISVTNGNVHLGDNYYNSIEYTELRQKIEDLEKLISLSSDPIEIYEYHKRLNETSSKLNTLKNEVIRLAETFQKIEIDTERLLKANEYFEKGKFKEARAVLDTEKMESELDALLKEKEALKKKDSLNQKDLLDKSFEYLILALLTSIDNNESSRFEVASEYFKKSLLANRNFINLGEYARFLLSNNKYEESIKYNLYSIKILRENTKGNLKIFAPILFDRLGDFAISLKMMKEYDKAEEYFLECIELAKNTSIFSSYESDISLSNALDRYGAFLFLKVDLPKAEDMFLQAIQLKRELVKKDKDRFLLSLATSLNNIGALKRDCGQLKVAEKYLLESIHLNKSLLETDIEVEEHISSYALSLNNLAHLYIKEKKFEESENLFLDSLDCRRKLVKINPYPHLKDLAMSLSNLTGLYIMKKDYGKAKNIIIEALEKWEQLAVDSPEAFSHSLAIVQQNMAVICFHDGHSDQAKLWVDKSIENLLPYFHIPFIPSYFEISINLLHMLGFDPEEYLKQNYGC